MPRRRRPFDPIPPADSALLRRALREAHDAVDDLLCDWLAADELADAIRAAVIELLRDVRLAIVVLDEPAPMPPVVHRVRAAAVHAALRVNAALASAYQERWASPRQILVACNAVARLIARLHAIAVPTEIPRWN